MFQPSQTLAWTIGSLGFSLIAIVIGGGIGGDGLLLCLGLAACSGLIGLVMLYFMILWSVWVRSQRAKPPEQLLREGKDYVSLKASSLSKRLVALIKDIVPVNILIFISFMDHI